MLGVDFDYLLENMELNITKKIDEIEKDMKKWEHRLLTPLGRACIVKTLLIPKITYISLTIPTIEKKIIKSLENKLYQFIWKGRDKVARADAKTRENRGGLNLPDLQSSWQAYKISWLRRLLHSPNANWCKILLETLKMDFPNLSIQKILYNSTIIEIKEIAKKNQKSFLV